jgi:hypothetical protein
MSAFSGYGTCVLVCVLGHGFVHPCVCVYVGAAALLCALACQCMPCMYVWEHHARIGLVPCRALTLGEFGRMCLYACACVCVCVPRVCMALRASVSDYVFLSHSLSLSLSCALCVCVCVTGNAQAA